MLGRLLPRIYVPPKGSKKVDLEVHFPTKYWTRCDQGLAGPAEAKVKGNYKKTYRKTTILGLATRSGPPPKNRFFEAEMPAHFNVAKRAKKSEKKQSNFRHKIANPWNGVTACSRNPGNHAHAFRITVVED